MRKNKIKEQNTISKSIIHSVLSKLFGVRIGLSFMTFKEGPSLKKKQTYIEELKTAEKEIGEILNRLSDNFE